MTGAHPSITPKELSMIIILPCGFVVSAGKPSVLLMEELEGLGGRSQPTVRRRGWLRKQGGFVKTWHTRWFVLRGDQLHYYKDEDETKALVSQNLPLPPASAPLSCPPYPSPALPIPLLPSLPLHPPQRVWEHDPFTPLAAVAVQELVSDSQLHR